MGQYQLAIHSETNRALQITNRQRYNRNMAEARHDVSLKAERNIEKDDDEFYYGRTITLLGDKVKVFPQTKRFSRYLIWNTIISNRSVSGYNSIATKSWNPCFIECNLSNSF